MPRERNVMHQPKRLFSQHRPATGGPGVTIGQSVPRLEDERLLCAGPGRVGQALGITRQHDGLPLDRWPFELRPAPQAPEVISGVRIGISKAQDLPWRFGLMGSRFVSRRF